MEFCFSIGSTCGSIRSKCTRIISPWCSSACESIVCSSLRIRPESEIFTGRRVWSTPEKKRTSRGLNTCRACSSDSMSRSVNVILDDALRVARRVVTL